MKQLLSAKNVRLATLFAVAAVLGVFAFSGPVAAGTLPVAGASLWLNAGAITGVSDGGVVTVWNDESGNGYNFSGTATYDASNANLINGNPVMHFNGSQALHNSSFNPAFGFTIFAVTDTDTLTPSGQAYGNQAYFGGGTNAVAFGLYSHTSIEPGNSFWAWAPLQWSVYGQSNSVNTNWNYHAYVVPSATETAWSWYLNGTAIGSAGQTAGTPVAYSVGCWVGTSGNTTLSEHEENWVGSIAEIIVYNRSLTVQEVASVNAYLNEKYFTQVSEPATSVMVIGFLGGLLCYAWKRRR